ncbi:MAG: type I-C CRISPR-associated protein Cas7/Csd2 [Gemmataceae bacterium]
MSVNRHDILIAFDVTNGNPNGDPDAGNMPRIEPNSGKGLVSDVCLKRKVRNFVALLQPKPTTDNQFGIFIQQGKILNDEIEKGIDAVAAPAPEGEGGKKGKRTKTTDSGVNVAEQAVKYLCKTFYDVRTFGGVLSIGDDVLKGSAYGQVRGPVQFTLGMSVDPITTQELTVTRCAVTKKDDAPKGRTMGHKHIVPYGLYVAKAFVSPLFAKNTGFDDGDLELFFDALCHMFSNDQSAARAEMCVRAIYVFEHVGTQPTSNNGQNRREQELGCAHAHKLFETVHIKRNGNSDTTFPTAFTDYDMAPDEGWDVKGQHPKYPGVTLHRLVG